MQSRARELNSIQPDDIVDDAPSRSQLRRDALGLFKLAQTLADLSDAQLVPLQMSEELHEEVLRTRATKQHIARKRQVQFLAKQLRKLDDEEIDAMRATLEHDRDQARRDTAALHRLEHWRERLITEGDAALSALVEIFPAADRQHLRQLARSARSEREQNRPPHAYRELLRKLKELDED